MPDVALGHGPFGIAIDLAVAALLLAGLLAVAIFLPVRPFLAGLFCWSRVHIVEGFLFWC